MERTTDVPPGAVIEAEQGVQEVAGMFLFFSNRLGCIGSILVSLVLTFVLVLVLRSCNTAAW